MKAYSNKHAQICKNYQLASKTKSHKWLITLYPRIASDQQSAGKGDKPVPPIK